MSSWSGIRAKGRTRETATFVMGFLKPCGLPAAADQNSSVTKVTLYQLIEVLRIPQKGQCYVTKRRGALSSWKEAPLGSSGQVTTPPHAPFTGSVCPTALPLEECGLIFWV